MMKTLYIIRHAKSSWKEADLSDFDRPLNDRGTNDAPRMARRLKEKDIHPNLLISSPAKRAITTCRKFAEVLGCPEGQIKTDRALYHADRETILSVIRKLKNTCNTVLLFGHNPGLTDFVNEFGADTFIDNIPTCGIVAFRLPVEGWDHVSWKCGEELFFDFPKGKRD